MRWCWLSSRLYAFASALIFAQAVCGAHAAELLHGFQEVRPGIYALVGDLGPQRRENQGLNANLGFVIGSDAVLVVNSGPSRRVGDAVLREIRARTKNPIRWVVNVNSQNHYWWGNSAFQAPTTTFIAHTAAVSIMREQVSDQRQFLNDLLGDAFAGSEPVFPSEMREERLVLDLGGRTVHVLHFGAGHTPGDLAVWLPNERILFSGDLIYTQRLPAVLPFSRTSSWVQAFQRIEQQRPEIVIPGHGAPTTLDRAKNDTLDYLLHLRAESKRLFEAGMAPSDAAQRIDQSRWRTLVNFEDLHRRNASLVFIEVERELF
jgi:glyoxylase-like metal-dependent hydrolase (beta-lactamase superfamily II)